MKRAIFQDGRGTLVYANDPPIPDTDLFVRFRSLVDGPPTTVPLVELHNTLDTRYLQPFLYFWPRTLHAKMILEIGAGRGGSTLPLLKAAAEMGGTLYSIDVNHAQQPYATEIAARYGLLGVFNRCDMSSDEFFATIGRDLAIDFVFVDGDHRAEGVYRDACNVLDRLVPGGVVMFHEYDTPGIPPWSTLEPWGLSSPPEFGGLDAGTPRALRHALAKYDVDVMPLHFGACGLERVDQWTEAGALVVRKRFDGEFRVKLS